ncbi:cysteine desulfurase family protein [Patescibacteria group bacterium]
MSIYLDNAASTALDSRVFDAIKPYLQDKYGNPSSFHQAGKLVKDDLDQARASLAQILNCSSDEILFVSGGTEADNLAVLGFARANQDKGKHIITTKIEHHAVLEAAEHLENKEGFEVTYLEPDQDGLITEAQVQAAIRPDTILISIMYANNEIGVIQPVSEIGNMIQKYRQSKEQAWPVFHTDACQATPYLEIDTDRLHVDLMSINGSKVYGPKGIGALYVKRGLKLSPIIFGGSQEKGLRAGTENVAGIIGLVKAVELTQKDRKKESERLTLLRDKLSQGILKTINKTRLNGHLTKRLPNNVNISFGDVEGEALLLYLDAAGIYASTGSACASSSLDPSHVLLAIGLPHGVAHGSIRFSLGQGTTNQDIDQVIEVLPPLVEKLRSISPIKTDEKFYV